MEDTEEVLRNLTAEIKMLSTKVDKLDLKEELKALNTTLATIVSVALNKTQGFSGKDVLYLLGGIAVFIVALLYGLDKLGVLTKILA
jgi:hypothetical protein